MAHATITAVQPGAYEPIISALERILNDLPPSAFPALLGELERLKALTFLQLVRNTADSSLAKAMELGQYLTVEQVCARYGVKPKWLYRHKKQMPHSQPSRKLVEENAAINELLRQAAREYLDRRDLQKKGRKA